MRVLDRNLFVEESTIKGVATDADVDIAAAESAELLFSEAAVMYKNSGNPDQRCKRGSGGPYVSRGEIELDSFLLLPATAALLQRARRLEIKSK